MRAIMEGDGEDAAIMEGDGADVGPSWKVKEVTVRKTGHIASS